MNVTGSYTEDEPNSQAFYLYYNEVFITLMNQGKKNNSRMFKALRFTKIVERETIFD